ncbi:MAG: SHOCT domain-containing protein [Chloroflexota bacterium]|jgi:hypothetical protein
MTFWDLLWFFFIVVPLTLLWIFTMVDVFSRPDLSGWAKALWVVAIIVLPWLGVLVYLIARPPTVAGVFAQPAPYPAGRPTVPTSIADELEKLSRLEREGIITDQEYETAKAAVLRKAA